MPPSITERTDYRRRFYHHFTRALLLAAGVIGISIDDVPKYGDDKVFKSSPLGKAIAMVIMFSIAIASLAAAVSGYKPHGMVNGAFYYFAVVNGLFGLIPYSLFRASLKPTNWLMRITSSGIIIKYRAYENWKLPSSGIQAVWFDFSEIDHAWVVKEHRRTPSSRGGREDTTPPTPITSSKDLLAAVAKTKPYNARRCIQQLPELVVVESAGMVPCSVKAVAQHPPRQWCSASNLLRAKGPSLFQLGAAPQV